MKAKDAIVWVNAETFEVQIHKARGSRSLGDGWSDPIGAAHAQWREITDDQRVTLMLETAIDLAMNDFELGNVLRAFSAVDEFKALGSDSVPMCRALTKALLGKSLEPNTMSFEELLVEYAARK